MATTGPVTPRQSAARSEEQPQEPALHPSESAVSSIFYVDQQPAPTRPMPQSTHSPPPPTRTPAPTLTARTMTMSAN